MKGCSLSRFHHFTTTPGPMLSGPAREGGAGVGRHNAIREMGGVFGVAVLASIFSPYGGYRTAETFSNGLNAAVYVGAAFVALAAFMIPRRQRPAEVEVLRPVLNEAA
jgi:hypothetical protein